MTWNQKKSMNTNLSAYQVITFFHIEPPPFQGQFTANQAYNLPMLLCATAGLDIAILLLPPILLPGLTSQVLCRMLLLKFFFLKRMVRYDRAPPKIFGRLVFYYTLF
jgi:hypothetical protein